MIHPYATRDEWFEALKALARKYENVDAIRDYEGWTYDWEIETPEYVYYQEFPEHQPSPHIARSNPDTAS